MYKALQQIKTTHRFLQLNINTKYSTCHLTGWVQLLYNIIALKRFVQKLVSDILEAEQAGKTIKMLLTIKTV